ncbi:hypothetical protein HELRODRAFT_184549, partial [Helobdella robusta]|uniref:Ig-like domain-containing protein n=1 Tax=Helobdella robusta TaxID=6412 RepID=T1FLG2_HELRO
MAGKLIASLVTITLSLLNGLSGFEPSFDVPILNVTVITGQVALLPCSIDHLGKHKVCMVVDDFRFSLIRPVPKEWNLQIRDVKYEDQGQYRCTLNTSPVKSKYVTLYVK